MDVLDIFGTVQIKNHFGLGGGGEKGRGPNQPTQRGKAKGTILVRGMY